jgi:quercetin dioxygenase-like cupin family protein
MNDKIRYKNSGQSSNEKKIDFNSGSAYWSIEGTNVQFTWFDVPANTSFSTHKHESEQITYVLEGELFFKSENSIYKLSAGDCILIPGNIDHEAWTGAMPAKAIDAWSPVNKQFTTNENSLNK